MDRHPQLVHRSALGLAGYEVRRERLEFRGVLGRQHLPLRFRARLAVVGTQLNEVAMFGARDDVKRALGSGCPQCLVQGGGLVRRYDTVLGAVEQEEGLLDVLSARRLGEWIRCGRGIRSITQVEGPST